MRGLRSYLDTILHSKGACQDGRHKSRIIPITKPMNQNQNITTTVISRGGMARHHVRSILPNFDNTFFPILCESSEVMYEEMVKVFTTAGRKAPPNEPDLARILTQ